MVSLLGEWRLEVSLDVVFKSSVGILRVRDFIRSRKVGVDVDFI